MKQSESKYYVKPAVDIVLLQPDSSILQSSCTGATTQALDEEDYQWL